MFDLRCKLGVFRAHSAKKSASLCSLNLPTFQPSPRCQLAALLRLCPVSRQGGPASPTHGSRPPLLRGFRLIAASPYLQHMCASLALGYVISSFFYFERALVVAAAFDNAAARTQTFAIINSVSAAAIVLLQLLATVRNGVTERLGRTICMLLRRVWAYLSLGRHTLCAACKQMSLHKECSFAPHIHMQQIILLSLEFLVSVRPLHVVLAA